MRTLWGGVRPWQVLVAAFVACEGGLFHIDVDQTATTRVEAGTVFESLVTDLGFPELVSLDITAAEELANQGVEPGDIAQARLTVFTLSAVEPQGADLSFLTSISLFIEAEGLERVRIASLADFPVGAASVDLNLDDVDLAPYVVSEALTITTNIEGRRPEGDTDVEAYFVLDIGVTGQGACRYIREG